MMEILDSIHQTVVYYRSVLKTNGVTFVLNKGSNQWGRNEARVACYQMGMVWKEGSGIN